MTVNKAVQKLHTDLTRLHRARAELTHDRKDHLHDRAELKHDRRALKTDRSDLKKDQRAVQQGAHARARDVAAKDKALAAVDQRTQAVTAELQADTFDHDPFQPGVQQNPALLQRLADLTQHRSEVATKFDTRLEGDRAAIDAARAAVGKDHLEIKQDRKAVAHAGQVLKHDHQELRHDHRAIKAARHRALRDLRPAEYKMGLKATNRARADLGLSRVDHVIRPMNLNTVQGCAQYLLKSGNVSFWSGLSSGSDRKNVERLARGQQAYVPATGGYVTPKLKMMQALVDMAKHGHIMINALTGGTHSTGSNHYSGTAVDLDLSTGNAGMIQQIAARYGGYRNYETDHIHLDF